MYNCIFAPYCIRPSCDKSCPTLAETSYLLERNRIDITNPVFRVEPEAADIACRTLSSCEGQVVTCVSPGNPEGTADVFTYCAICQNWRGSRLHCVVYHLNFARYIELIKSSWSTSAKSEELEYMDIWIKTSKVLIISGFRYMRFNDFECQTMLGLLDARRVKQQTTVVVSPSISSLVGNSTDFLPKLKSVLGRAVVE